MPEIGPAPLAPYDLIATIAARPEIHTDADAVTIAEAVHAAGYRRIVGDPELDAHLAELKSSIRDADERARDRLIRETRLAVIDDLIRSVGIFGCADRATLRHWRADIEAGRR